METPVNHNQLTLEQRAVLLVDSVRDYAIFFVSPQGRIESWNAGARMLKGYTAAEIVGEPVSRFYTAEDREAGLPERLLRIAAEQGRVETEGWRVRRDGSRFWADVVITALRDEKGDLQGFAKITRDRTDRKRLEEERVRRVQAEEALRLRDQFLSIASHELRTPLTALQLQLEDLRLRLAGADGKIQQRIGRALRSGERMAALIDALLDVARISTGRLTFTREPFDLGEAVGEVVERFSSAAANAGCELSLEIEPGIVGAWDRLRIEQVVVNLLSNAMKFGAGAPIRVALQRCGAGARLEVRDHGPGVPAEDLVRIFGRFERSTSERHHGGLGLGLYVTHEIVAGHGGTVEARNAPGGGALFIVQLPVEPVGADGGRKAG